MLSKPIAKLIELQNKEELTDREMAERLGCSRQLWQMTRTEKIPLGNTIVKCISANFPELRQDVLKILSQNMDRLTEKVDKNPLRATSGALGRGLKRFCGGLLGRIRK